MNIHTYLCAYVIAYHFNSKGYYLSQTIVDRHAVVPSLRCYIVLIILSLGYWRAYTKGTAYTKGAYPQPRETKETSFSQDHMIFGHDKDGKLQIQILP